MTYADSEASKHGGKPVELFRYVGTYESFFYTSGQKVVSFQGPDEDAPNDYIPLNMRRTAVSQVTADDDNAEVTIEMPVTTDIIAIYGFQVSPPALELTIFRTHGADYVRYWSGPVENINVAKGTASVRVPSLLASALSADFPNVYYQGPCNHNLFDARCGVDPEDWTVNTSITAIGTRTITVATVGTLGGKLVGGDALLPSGERRMIVAQTGNVLTLNYPFAGAAVTNAIIIMTGCDLAWAGDCKTRYDNTRRFGGFPFIPPKNIFASGLESGKDVADEACLPTVFDGIYFRLYFNWNVPVNGSTAQCACQPQDEDGQIGGRQPNGPGGKIIPGNWYNQPDIYENNVPDNPLLNGQLLFRTYVDPLDIRTYVWEFGFPIDPTGDWTALTQFGAFTISANTPARFSMIEFLQTGPAEAVVLQTQNVGPLFPDYWAWSI